MIGLNTAAVYVLQTLGSLYLLIVLLRFVLQLVRANFYNPLCQFVVKATQPLLKPLRRIIPSMFGLDMSSLVLAMIVQTGADGRDPAADIRHHRSTRCNCCSGR